MQTKTSDGHTASLYEDGGMMKKDNTIASQKFGKEAQISYRSTPDIVGKLDLAAARLATIDRFDGKKVRTGYLANALALWVETLSMDQLRAQVSPMLRALERHMEGGTAILEEKTRGAHGEAVGRTRAARKTG